MLPTTNAHTHLELTDLARLCPASPQPFFTWLRALAWALLWRRKKDVSAAVERGIAELRACSTTHVGDVTATGQSVAPLLASGLHGIVYLEVAGLARKPALARLKRAQARIAHARATPAYGRMLVGLSLHAPYSCHPDLLRQGAAWCRAEGVPLCIHVAESQAEADWLYKGRLPSLSTSETLLAKGLGLRPARSPGQRPIPYLASLGVLDARPLLVHAVHLTGDEIQQIAGAGCAVAHCPRSNQRLSCGRMPLERYLAAGVPVYLGTDSRASSPSLNVHDEAAYAQELHAERVAPARIQQLLHRDLP
jgi:cytosine/adenosine deaminase-related metal-dependent hydrolase